MIDNLVCEGKITDHEVERAFRRVKRHYFLEGIVEPEEAYVDSAIMIKGNISSSSQPHVMAMMLEALELKRGMKVLEIGTASGYNAALLAEIVGRNSLIYTIEVESDLAQRAERILSSIGYPEITVITGDGRKGYPAGVPFDRIIVTAGAKEIYAPLLKQLAGNGIILIPFDFYGIITVTLKLYLQPDKCFRGSLVGFPVSFVPIRGKDVEEQIDQKMVSYYYQLGQHLLSRGMELSQHEIAGLLILMIHYYKKEKLARQSDYENLIDHWLSAGRPEIIDFEFEYDQKTLEWHLIPVF